MEWVSRIREAIGFIESSLLGQVDAEKLGKAINDAPSSFQSLFGAMTGYSVGEYIRFRRLSRAADELNAGGITVTDRGRVSRYRRDAGSIARVVVDSVRRHDERLGGRPIAHSGRGHHYLTPPRDPGKITVPHPESEPPIGTARNTPKQAGMGSRSSR